MLRGKVENNNAIILAMFGTSVEKALPGLLNIRGRMIEAFPGTPVRIAFTSKILRRIWHQRAEDSKYRADHSEIPVEVFTVQDPLSVVADLLDTGYCGIVLQPVYMTPAEEYYALLTAVESFRQDNNVPFVTVGRPALGGGVTEPSEKDLTAAARVLACDAEYARERNAALVYMGHGSKHLFSTDTDTLYQKFASVMRRLYPDVVTYVATVEGSLVIDEMLPLLQKRGVGTIILKPLMVVAGDHVRRDMIGPAPRGWKKRFEQEGFSVEAVLRGLGEQDAFADIFVHHAADGAAGTDIDLR